MRKIIFILSVISFGISAAAQESYLSREAYRDKVEAYSQLLKQQRLKATASTEARKIAQTGFLPKIDITAEGTANLSHLDAWNSPAGQYRPYTYQALATLGQPLYTGGSLMARKKIAKADEELDKLATELTLDQIHYQSDAVYWNASAALATLKAAARFEGIVSQQYNIIQDRFNDGAISRTDLLMISTRKKEAELQYIKARQNYTLALQQLNILMGQDVPHTPIAGINLNIPIFRWGARFKTNRQQKAYIGIQKLQQSYVADTILEELSAATTKLTETEQQVKTAWENMALAEENLDLVTFSYNEGKASMVDVLSAQLSWTQAQTNLINAHLAAKMAVAEYRKAISE